MTPAPQRAAATPPPTSAGSPPIPTTAGSPQTLAAAGSPQAPVTAGSPPPGLRVATSVAPDAAGAVAEIAAGLRDGPTPGFLLVFASSHYDPEALVAELTRHFGDLPRAGCSTAGEIAPSGITEHSVVALSFPSDTFEIVAAPLERLSEFGIEAGSERVSDLRRRLAATRDDDRCGVFAVTLLDGLCQREEQILSALQRALDDIPLVGGSSGDDLAFQDTFAFHGDRLLRDAGLLLLVRSTLPFRVFKSDHFEPTSTKMVVTACDPDARVVFELDAEPAWRTFADAAGIASGELDRLDLAAHPLVVRVGGDYYCRSVQKMNADGSLSFYCAIDDGVVLTLARTRDMVECLSETLTEIDAELGGIAFVVGFDCVHRRLEAESRQILDRISDLFRRWHVVGFNTYGEQFGAMHLNHTFTGIAFGRAREVA